MNWDGTTMKEHLISPVIRLKFRLPILIIYFLFSGFLISIYANTYYVSATANGSGSGSQANPWTLKQAIANVTAGDTIFLSVGIYDVASGAAFTTNGTSTNPIVWIGTISSNDWSVNTNSVDGSTSTLLRNVTSSIQGLINMGGNYNEFHNMVLEQDYPAKNLITVSGNYVMWDSVAYKYPSAAGSGSNHNVMVYGQHVTFYKSTFRNSSRTCVWVRSSTSSAPNNFLVDGCVFKGMSNHYAIQVMPQTSTEGVKYIDSTIIRNSLFIDIPYEASLYFRYCRYFKIYNNEFIRTKVAMIYEHHRLVSIGDTVNTHGGLFAYNTIVENTNSIGVIVNWAAQGLIVKNNLCYNTNANGWYYVFRYGHGGDPNYVTPINLREQFDYNLYYQTQSSTYTWLFETTSAGSRTTTNYATFNAYDGNNFNVHSILGVAPTFTNASSDNYTPLNGTSPQVGAAEPISGINTDKNGNTRDATHPTIGAFEYTTGGGGGNIAPNQPTNPSPTNGAINKSISSTLSWNCSDPNGDPLTYSVYFGTANNPPLVASNQSNASYNPGQLNNNTIYYWKIVAKDNLGATTSGPVWNFSTINATGGGGNDVIPPKLIRVQCIQSDKVVLDFSEPLNEGLASNLGNYVISNQIHVLGATIDSSLDRITLTTDPATVNQLYTVTVSNLTDTAGNLISSQANSLFYKLLEVGSTGYINYLIDNVEASSTSDTNTSASKTLDGLVNGDPDPNSRWASQAMPQWIQFDLGAPEPVNLIAVSFYQWNNGRIYHYSIETSDDSVKWQQIVTNASSASQEWTINDFTNLTTRYIRIICLSNNQGDWAGIWEARVLKSDKATSIEESNIPQSFALEQNYPNPFNPTTNIRFSIPRESFVTLKVYDILGNEIATLVNERKPQGSYNVNFNASNLASGIYFCRIQASNFISTRKMILLK